MSADHPQRDFDFWEYVHCVVCYLPFIIDPIHAPTAPPNTPFWLTDCGHTLCNSHLKPDQSCTACGAAAIQLIPLHKEMASPMSDWFHAAPRALDAIASAAKFQQETMASLLDYYKRKCTQYRTIAKRVNEVEADNKSLKSQIEQLQRKLGELTGEKRTEPNQGSHLHSSDGQGDRVEPSDALNANGKRPLTSIRNDQQMHRSSSPRSVITPAGPSRLTLPPDRQPPSLSPGISSLAGKQPPTGRSVSRRLDQYVYQSPMTPVRPMPLRHHQQTHIRQQPRELINHVTVQQPRPYGHNSNMPPPPSPMAMQGNTNEPRRTATSGLGSGHFRPATGNYPASRHTLTMIPASEPPGDLYPQRGPAMHRTHVPQHHAMIPGRPQSVLRAPKRFFPSATGPLYAPSPQAAGRNPRTPFVPGPNS